MDWAVEGGGGGAGAILSWAQGKGFWDDVSGAAQPPPAAPPGHSWEGVAGLIKDTCLPAFNDATTSNSHQILSPV